MENHINNKLTITPKKITLEFTNDPSDPFMKTIIADGPRSVIIQSHIDAIAETVIADAKAKYAEDKNQMTMFDGDENPKDHRAGEVGEETEGGEEDPTHFVDPDDEANDDYSNVAVPLIDGTQMPDFKAMLIEHAEWYINNHYTGEDGEPGASDLIQDIKHSIDVELDAGFSLENTKDAAISSLVF